MAVVLNFATFKATVLKKIDDVFPDRLAQLREQEALFPGGVPPEQVDPSSENYEGAALILFLTKLRDIQRRNSSFIMTSYIEEGVLKMSAICERVKFKMVSAPVLAQIESILQQYHALCLYHTIFTMHAQIYSGSAECTSTTGRTKLSTHFQLSGAFSASGRSLLHFY